MIVATWLQHVETNKARSEKHISLRQIAAPEGKR
jgi:hypothetical protein